MLKYSLMLVCCVAIVFCFISVCVSYDDFGEAEKPTLKNGKYSQEYTITFENTGNVPLTDIVFNVTRKSLGLHYPFLIEETKQVTFDLVPPHTTLSNTTTFTYPYLSIEIWSKYTHERVSP